MQGRASDDFGNPGSRLSGRSDRSPPGSLGTSVTARARRGGRHRQTTRMPRPTSVTAVTAETRTTTPRAVDVPAVQRRSIGTLAAAAVLGGVATAGAVPAGALL